MVSHVFHFTLNIYNEISERNEKVMSVKLPLDELKLSEKHYWLSTLVRNTFKMETTLIIGAILLMSAL